MRKWWLDTCIMLDAWQGNRTAELLDYIQKYDSVLAQTVSSPAYPRLTRQEIKRDLKFQLREIRRTAQQRKHKRKRW